MPRPPSAPDRPGAAMSRFVAIVDRLSAACGRFAGWLALACVLLVFAQVVARYGFGRSSIAAQEAVLWLHAALFLLGLAWALARDAHVRVDLYRQRWSPRTQAWAELIGTLALLLPFCVFALWICVEYVAESWRIRESSREPGGLPALYLLKALFPAAMALLALQGLAQAAKAVATLRGRV